ncbi:unnamed protein product [Rotaria sp. Silwood1]|nr:unnamed protein product [Rotaria sp. Silwood1]CAF1499160.1 unnamed protein product [Rotaria sp. Silwood1]
MLGLSPMSAPPETLLVFSCGIGQGALDETQNGQNSIFTEKLLKHIATPDEDIESLLMKVTRDVRDATGGYQIPYRQTCLTEKIFLTKNLSPVPLRASSTAISPNAKWTQNGITVAGGNEWGSETNKLHEPYGLYVDDDQTIYVADEWNHRIVEWKSGATNGKVVAGGNGSRQLYNPLDVIVDKESDSLIISDCGHNRVVRWPRRNGTRGETIISNIACFGLTMDDNGSLYVVDYEKHEVRRYKIGDTKGTLVAGGNGQGSRLDQLSGPSYVFVDRDHSVYVSDLGNDRVMKWEEGAKQGIVVADGQEEGNSLSQLNCPQGVVVDQLGTVYVTDSWNHRIMRWPKGATQGSVIVGGLLNQLQYPVGLSFDRHGNLYVVDYGNHRVQKFNIVSNSI